MPADLPALPAEMSQILAIRLDNIGDVVMTGPALRTLKSAYPAACLTLMASPAGSQVGPLLPWVDEVIAWRALWQQLGRDLPVEPEKELMLFNLLREHRFDAAFIFTSFSQSPHPPAYACYMAGIPVRVGESKEFGGALLTHWVPSLPDSAHQVERNLHLVRSTGLPSEDSSLELHVPPENVARAGEILRDAGIYPEQDYIVIAPGASCPARRYAENRFAQAASQLSRRSGLPVVLVGSPREAGTFPILEKLDETDGVFSLVGKTTVPEMASILQGARVVIANNSGSMHMAAAFKRPMVILFSGTELLKQWAPSTPGVHFLTRATPCSPCHGFQCPYRMECLEIPADEIVEHTLELLEESAAHVSTKPDSSRGRGVSPLPRS